MAGGAGWLVIFDCDGVLVDSEPIALAVLSDMLCEAGVRLKRDEIFARFLGRSLRVVTKTVLDEHGVRLGAAFADQLRSRLFERYDEELKPVPGIAEALDALDAGGVAYCVASSSQPDRIEKSLRVTGLLDRFEGRMFSASMVERGKPAPDLFLHAAVSLGYPAARAIVVEDSPAGIEAAQAAGMKVLAFSGGSHASGPAYDAMMTGRNPDARFDVMRELLQLVDRMRSSEKSLHG